MKLYPFLSNLRASALVLAFPAFCLAAVSPVLTVTGTQELDGPPSSVVLTYTLDDAPGIVLFDVLTNGVSIGGANIQRVSGDVNRLVQPGENRTVRWYPGLDWPGHQTGAGEVTYRLTALPQDRPPLYMVVDLCTKSNVTYYTDTEFLPFGGLSSDVYRADRLVMRRIDARGVTWQMGTATNAPASPNNASDRLYQFPREKLHEVTLTNNYYIGVFEVTQQQWWNIARGWKGLFTDERTYRPVENVMFNDIRGSGCYWPADPAAGSFLGKARAFTGVKLDLPSEAQWEYAARAGHYGNRTGNGMLLLGNAYNTYVRYNGNSGCSGTPTIQVIDGDKTNKVENAEGYGVNRGTAVVGSYKPNDWDLYDTIGNVWEWVLDPGKTDISANTHGEIPGISEADLSGGNHIVVRGGCYYTGNRDIRPAFRGTAAPNTNWNGSRGFRVALTLPNE
ncbi:MAG: formylglycine-generating enzyme family protein [Kiritimatiellae bacterium]|nr:formylglycine-generating enzyme family protein [Kiritimatiellia bacterium]